MVPHPIRLDQFPAEMPWERPPSVYLPALSGCQSNVSRSIFDQVVTSPLGCVQIIRNLQRIWMSTSQIMRTPWVSSHCFCRTTVNCGTRAPCWWGGRSRAPAGLEDTLGERSVRKICGAGLLFGPGSVGALARLLSHRVRAVHSAFWNTPFDHGRKGDENAQ